MRSGVLLAAAVLGLAITAARAAQDKQNFTIIERGRYLALLGDCAACHTEPGSGQAFAGGRPIETPFGTVLAPNITPDRDTGIGAWTDDEFVDALQKGVGRGGVHLYPAMPYTYYTRATREDVLAIRAYLATVAPVRHAVVSNQLPFPFDIRASMLAWNRLFFSPGRLAPTPAKSAEWNRGAYLVEGLAHCGMCHTPKNFLGGDETSQHLKGNVVQGWYAPDITDDARRGLGGWSVDDIVAYLRSGHNRIAAASGPMAEEVTRSSAQMDESDLRAIAVYLKDQPGGEEHAAPLAVDDARMRTGSAIYADECSACHTPNGGGIAGLFPALNGAPAVQSADPTSLIRVVLQGAQSAATPAAPTGPAMPQFAWLLDNAKVASVITYIRNAWGNAAPPVSIERVAAERHRLSRRAD
ncbi:MAG: cytochrome c [Acidisphaera sp.]|nr:cytochrome c [Acidisphaera sp.]